MRYGDTDDAISHHHSGELICVGLRLNWSVFLERPYNRTPRESAGSLSIQPIGCTPWCSTVALLLFTYQVFFFRIRVFSPVSDT